MNQKELLKFLDIASLDNLSEFAYHIEQATEDDRLGFAESRNKPLMKAAALVDKVLNIWKANVARDDVDVASVDDVHRGSGGLFT